MSLMFLTAWQPTEQSRAVCAAVNRALARLGLPLKVIADATGLDLKRLYRQLACREPLNLWRFADVPGFMRALAVEVAEDEGLVMFPRELVRLIVQVQETPRPMLRVSWPDERQKESA